jgi:hypothetical protein
VLAAAHKLDIAFDPPHGACDGLAVGDLDLRTPVAVRDSPQRRHPLRRRERRVDPCHARAVTADATQRLARRR